MTPRKRSQDLAADLMHDIAEELADSGPAPVAAAPIALAPVTDLRPTPAPSAFVETSLFLPLNAWLRPQVSRVGATVSVDIGPLRVRVGRG